ncbi:MAG: elongation factor P [Alphaproteobacteria bacterium]|nr:elongation factor P [Alphaproteobacteria bacterium]
MKIDGVSIRPGNVLQHKNRLWVVTRTQHTQPGKGGAYMQVEMKDIRDGTKLNERFRSAETVERVRLDQRDFQFLYDDGEFLNFMQQEDFEQIQVKREFVGEAAAYLQEGMIVMVESFEGEPIGVQLPTHVTCEIVEADPVVKGQTAASSYKPAVLDNGLRVMVPPFIESGTRIVVNTEDNTYVERAK